MVITKEGPCQPCKGQCVQIPWLFTERLKHLGCCMSHTATQETAPSHTHSRGHRPGAPGSLRCSQGHDLRGIDVLACRGLLNDHASISHGTQSFTDGGDLGHQQMPASVLQMAKWRCRDRTWPTRGQEAAVLGLTPRSLQKRPPPPTTLFDEQGWASWEVAVAL